MIEIFRKNLFINSLLLLPYTFLVRIGTLINPVAYPVSNLDGHLNEVIFSFFGSALSQNIVACFLVYLQAVAINRLIIVNRIIPEITLLPGLFYILLTTLIPDYAILSPALIANTFILVAITKLFRTYNKPRAVVYVFDTGFYISVASLFYFPYLWYLPAGFIGLMILRSFKFSNQIQYFIGLFIPYFLFGVYSFWNGKLKENVSDYLYNNLGFQNIFSNLTIQNLILLGVVVFLIVTLILSYNLYSLKKSIRTQKLIDIFYWLLLCSGLGILLSRNIHVTHLILIMIPSSALLTMNFLKIKNPLTGEVIHLIILVIIVILHFNFIPF